MPAPDRSRAMEHIVVALFENRSLDNVLGHLYGPEDGKTFNGVIGCVPGSVAYCYRLADDAGAFRHRHQSNELRLQIGREAGERLRLDRNRFQGHTPFRVIRMPVGPLRPRRRSPQASRVPL